LIGYKHPCRYCDELIPPNSKVCPLCGRVNPLGSLRCPNCRDVVRRQWKNCSNCGISLSITCPYCDEPTYFGDYCYECDARLMVVCSNEECELEQPPIGEQCKECGKALEPLEDGGES